MAGDDGADQVVGGDVPTTSGSWYASGGPVASDIPTIGQPPAAPWSAGPPQMPPPVGPPVPPAGPLPAAPPRRSRTRSALIVASSVLAVLVTTAALVVAITARRHHVDASATTTTTSTVAPTTSGTAPPPTAPPPTAPPPTTPVTTPPVTTPPWFGSTVAMLWSKVGRPSDPEVQQMQAQRAAQYGVPTVVVDGNDYRTLNPGTVGVAYAGGFADPTDAARWCVAHGAVRHEDCYGVGLNDDWGPKDSHGTGRMYIDELTMGG